MKVNGESDRTHNLQEKAVVAPDTIVGDVIGGTVYSQRFVLKILLKFANLDTYKEEVDDENFETDMCTLWDMTTERDVVNFLLEHDIYNLLQFVLPTTSNTRIMEIIIGMTGNLCCTKPSVSRLLGNKDLCLSLLAHSHTDDSLVLIQIMRFINACLPNSEDGELRSWLNMFEQSELPCAISFIMKYSANKQVLWSTLETLRCICISCNIDALEHIFFELFVQENLVDSVIVAFWELQKLNKNESLDNLNFYFTMYLYINMNLSGFNNSLAKYSNHFSATLDTLIEVLNYYTKRAIKWHLDDTLVQVVELTSIICASLLLYSEQSMRQLLHHMFTLFRLSSPDHTGHSNNTTIELNKIVSKFFASYLGSVTDVAMKLHNSSNMEKNISAIMNNIKKLNLSPNNITDLEMRVKALCNTDDT